MSFGFRISKVLEDSDSQRCASPSRDFVMANDKDKTKAQLIAELEEMRQENAGLRRQMTEDDMAVVRRRLVAERVRTETMAMKTSNDLLKVVGQFFQGIKELGVKTHFCGIYFLDENANRLIDYRAATNQKKYGISWTSPELIEFSEDITVSMRDQVLSEGWSNWRGSEGQEHWQKQKVHTYTSNISREKIEYFLEHIGATISTSFEPYIGERIGEYAVTNVPFKHGMVGFRVREYNDEYVVIVRELTEALSLGYLRFLDFQHLEEQNREIQENTRRKSDFLARMSHDLRTPMNAIIGYTRLLLRKAQGKLDSRQLRNLENIDTSAHNLLNLINEAGGGVGWGEGSFTRSVKSWLKLYLQHRQIPYQTISIAILHHA